MRYDLSDLLKFFASVLLAMTISISGAVAQDVATVSEITDAFEEVGLGLAAKAKADADVALAQTAYESAVAAMSTPAVTKAVADIERLQVALEALSVAKTNGANVANAITAAEAELRAAKAIVDATKPAYDEAEANLAAAIVTAGRIKASYDDALALIATAIAEPNAAAVMAELDAANARIAHLNLKLGRAEREQAEINAHFQEQIDAGGASILALGRVQDDMQDADVNLQIQIDELVAADASQADFRVAVQEWVLHMCPRLRDDHIYSYKETCAAVKATTP